MTQIQLRRGTASEWSSANPVLAAGEVGIIGTTGDFKIGDGATTWNLLPTLSSRYAPISLGTIAYAERVTDQTGITALADITSLTVTFTAVAGRRYRTTVRTEVVATVADGAYVLWITDGAGSGIARATDACLTTSGRTVTATLIEVPGAGSITRKARLQKAGGTGSVTAQGTSTKQYIIVEDIGV